MGEKILITPRSFKNYKHKTYPLIEEKGYEIIENNFGRTLTEGEIIECAKEGVVGIIAGLEPFTASVLSQLKDLKAISRYGVGMDNIDLKAAAEKGIKVKNAVGSNSISVAELTIALMFTMARSVYANINNVKNGRWESEGFGFELTGKKLGLIGCGQIGREVAKRARGLEMDVSVYDPYFNDEEFLSNYGIHKCANLEELISGKDIISLHVPATEETKHIINKNTLSLMKENAILINTSRGALVDEEALYEALTSGKIAGAAQDVFSTEPPAAGEKLIGLDNFILTPHIGSHTKEAGEKMAVLSTINLLEMLGHKV